MPTLRLFQVESIRRARAGNHVLCVAPTGSGKSRIFEALARDRGARTAIVSPLRALARQQRTKLAAIGLKRASARVISPEALASPEGKEWLSAFGPSRFVVDECHLIWEWGRGFRPAFSRLPAIAGELARRGCVSLFLTATLPSHAREWLVARLPGPLAEVGGFGLPTGLRLEQHRISEQDRAGFLRAWLSIQRAPGIVFTFTRAQAERVLAELREAGESACLYHAGLAAEERRAGEDGIAAQKARIVVATSAFGLGMDFPHFEWVILWHAPPSLLALAQAAGRAGRGGQDARVVVLWDSADFDLLSWVVETREKRMELGEVFRFLQGGAQRGALCRYFGGEADASWWAPFRCGGTTQPLSLGRV